MTQIIKDNCMELKIKKETPYQKVIKKLKNLKIDLKVHSLGLITGHANNLIKFPKFNKSNKKKKSLKNVIKCLMILKIIEKQIMV